MVSEEIKNEMTYDYWYNGLSLRGLSEKYHINSYSYIKRYVLENKVRNYSEANKLAHKLHPEAFKHSEEAKKKMSEKRCAWMKLHPEKTAWRLKNMSYPEKCFQILLEENKLNEKYLIYREYSVFPYFIDFAFVDEKLAIEIDGSQHLEYERKERDKKKDELLYSEGWRVLRITAHEIMKNKDNVLSVLLSMLNSKAIKYEKVGIFKAPKKDTRKKKGPDGKTEKQREAALRSRKVKWPNKEDLFELIQNKSFCEIGRMYGVTDNAVRKWCKCYEIPYRKRDLKEK